MDGPAEIDIGICDNSYKCNLLKLEIQFSNANFCLQIKYAVDVKS